MSEWKKIKLGDLITIKHGYAFDGEHISQDDNGKVLVTPGNFQIGGGFQENKCKFFTGDIPEDYILKANDLIVTMTDLSKTIDTLGYSALIPYSEKRIYLHNQRIGLVKIKNADCNKKYLYYAMQTNEYQKSVAGTSSGATVHHTSPSKIYDVSINLPPLSVQQKIADTLSAYDDLIENNRKQIKLLEEAAQKLYKEWFVKLNFPGHENTKIVDDIPDGWKKGVLSDISNILMGQSPKSEFYNTEHKGLPFHQGVGSYGNRFVEDEVYSTDFTRIAEAGSILFSVRAPVGRLNITKNKIVIGRGLSAMNQKEGYQSFLFYMLKEKFFKDDIIGNGSIFASISKNELLSQSIIIPTTELMKKFDNIVSVYDKKLNVIDNQINKLKAARNKLLPRLMNGNLEV